MMTAAPVGRRSSSCRAWMRQAAGRRSVATLMAMVMLSAVRRTVMSASSRSDA